MAKPRLIGGSNNETTEPTHSPSITAAVISSVIISHSFLPRMFKSWLPVASRDLEPLPLIISCVFARRVTHLYISAQLSGSPWIYVRPLITT